MIFSSDASCFRCELPWVLLVCKVDLCVSCLECFGFWHILEFLMLWLLPWVCKLPWLRVSFDAFWLGCKVFLLPGMWVSSGSWTFFWPYDALTCVLLVARCFSCELPWVILYCRLSWMWVSLSAWCFTYYLAWVFVNFGCKLAWLSEACFNLSFFRRNLPWVWVALSANCLDAYCLGS